MASVAGDEMAGDAERRVLESIRNADAATLSAALDEIAGGLVALRLEEGSGPESYCTFGTLYDWGGGFHGNKGGREPVFAWLASIGVEMGDDTLDIARRAHERLQPGGSHSSGGAVAREARAEKMSEVMQLLVERTMAQVRPALVGVATPPRLSPAIARGGATYFLSGVMGGSGAGSSSAAGLAMESQDYRQQVRAAILGADAGARIIDPLALGEARAAELFPPGAPAWEDDGDVRRMFAEVVAAAAAADVVVSYLPTASMGSAVELHAAHAAGRTVLSVAPGKMRANWVVRAYSARVFEDVAGLAAFLADARRGAGGGGESAES